MQENRSKLLDFYAGIGADNRGRKIENIWTWSHEKLEQSHDFIQWIFPLPEVSSFNPDAPVLTVGDIINIRRSEVLKDRVLRSLDLMLAFYGFVRIQNKANTSIITSQDYENRIRAWVTPRNHNFFRISRILKLNAYSVKFFEALEGLCLDKQNIIGSESFQYWKAAVEADRGC